MTEQDEIYALLDKYNGAIEPIENWETADISKLITLLDAELQRRYHSDEHLINDSWGEFVEDDYDDLD